MNRPPASTSLTGCTSPAPARCPPPVSHPGLRHLVREGIDLRASGVAHGELDLREQRATSGAETHRPGSICHVTTCSAARPTTTAMRRHAMPRPASRDATPPAGRPRRPTPRPSNARSAAPRTRHLPSRSRRERAPPRGRVRRDARARSPRARARCRQDRGPRRRAARARRGTPRRSRGARTDTRYLPAGSVANSTRPSLAVCRSKLRSLGAGSSTRTIARASGARSAPSTQRELAEDRPVSRHHDAQVDAAAGDALDRHHGREQIRLGTAHEQRSSRGFGAVGEREPSLRVGQGLEHATRPRRAPHCPADARRPVFRAIRN